jgi:hypothetical protein
MTMVYLANVPSVETPWGIECYTQHAHVSIDYPIETNPFYYVIVHWGRAASRNFERFDQAMDYAARAMQQAEPA